VEGREGQNPKNVCGETFARNWERNESFQDATEGKCAFVLLVKEGIVDLEGFEMEISNRMWNGHHDDKMTIQENGRFGRGEEGLICLGINNSIGLAGRSLVS
jgi:hypothetical protein